jgi:hypothetical protein
VIEESDAILMGSIIDPTRDGRCYQRRTFANDILDSTLSDHAHSLGGKIASSAYHHRSHNENREEQRWGETPETAGRNIVFPPLRMCSLRR